MRLTPTGVDAGGPCTPLAVSPPSHASLTNCSQSVCLASVGATHIFFLSTHHQQQQHAAADAATSLPVCGAAVLLPIDLRVSSQARPCSCRGHRPFLVTVATKSSPSISISPTTQHHTSTTRYIPNIGHRQLLVFFTEESIIKGGYITGGNAAGCVKQLL